MQPRVLGTVHTVLRGPARPYLRLDGRDGGLSAIDKQAVTGPVQVGFDGLAGDEQGDRRVHGGPDKAVHQYALEHYEAWRRELGPLAVLQAPPAFGENFSSTGVSEEDICLGDRLRVGSCVLEVSQSRQPCWKLNTRFGRADMALRVQQSGRTGWYYRVLEPGQVQAGDKLNLLERPHPRWPLSRVITLLYVKVLDLAQLRELAGLPLTPSWQKLVRHRLERHSVEDWERRTLG
ncbi:MOSC domain-containing protein [Comamonas sp. NLF-1-9]|uniref:MOSC domain-containing protein n=1 Tax=Comamonas sp. NLF-1-9 TaxID=2853163 RepID=UPI001C43C2F0|nr:MOSC domain-containing protein [Comamonas sp. NLF-1-9]QXL83872.1 MOSC domain-containing protein [Comamonas sp. NLF-1-9]